MADNLTLNAGTGGSDLATDDVTDAGGAHYQRVKLTDGTANSTTHIHSGGGVEANALRVTIASDSTGLVSVDDNGGSLTVDNGGTFATQVDGDALTALQLIDDVVHVDDTATHSTGSTKGALIMGAATPTDGSVDANDIGAVAMSLDRRLHVDADITAQSAGDLTIADGGNSITVDWNGTAPPIGAGTEAAALRVTVATDSTGVLTVDNGGTFAVQEDGAALTALQLLDDIVHVDDTATHATGSSKGALFMAAATPTDGSVGANDIGAVAMSTDRRLHVDADITAQSVGDLTIADGGNSITVDWNGTAPPIGAGTEAGALRVTVATDSTGVLTVDNAGTFATQVDGDALTALQTIDNSIFADDAAFTLTSSSVNMAGAIRDDALSTLTAVEGDAVPLRVSATGALHVTGGGGGTEYTAGTDTFSEATTIVSGAGVVRKDSGASLVDTDNELTMLQVDSAGALRVTGGGGGTEYTEDVATPNPIVGTATVMERDDALATLTPAEADWAAMRCSAEGALWVQDFNSDAILADTGTIAGDTTSIDGKITACNTGAVVLSSGTVTTVSTVTNLSQLGGAAITMNTGTRDAGTQRVTLATDDSLAVTNAGTFATQATLQTGSATIGKLAANSGVDIGDVDVLSIAAGSNVIGDVGISGARTSGGTTLYRNVDVDESEDQVKGSAGQVYWIHAMNLTAAVLYLQIYNATAASVTVGTTTPDLTFPLATQGDTNGAGFTFAIPNGIAFGTAITIACTTTITGSSGPAANGCVVNLGYA